jgi:uncharacterized protein YuzE
MHEATHGGLRAEHDTEADAVYVYFSDREYSHGRDLDVGRRIDYAADGSVVGVELLSPSIGVDLTGLPRAADLAVLLRRLDLPALQPAG